MVIVEHIAVVLVVDFDFSVEGVFLLIQKESTLLVHGVADVQFQL
jgi:hypothetical protein